MSDDDPAAVVDEGGDLHFFRPEVWRALAAVGLIWRDGDAWRMDSRRVDLGQWPELAVCDFCSDQPVTWAIDVADFAIVYPGAAPLWRSVDGWLACEACGGLITAGDRAGVDARSLAFIRRRVPAGYPVGPFLVAQLELLAGFWRHYRGIRRYQTPYEAGR